jgi:3-oxoacyl-[acyl-carrier-protein] synthase-1
MSVGQVSVQLPELVDVGKIYRSRNNQILLLALQQIEAEVGYVCNQYGHDRIAIILGTSTSGIAEAEYSFAQHVRSNQWPDAYDYGQQDIGSPALFLAEYLNVTGPAYTISTACSSGAKALASAKRLLALGVCDAVVAGGVDSLCGLTVQGFSALDAMSKDVCNPFSRNRDGINIGEGSALFLVSKEAGPVRLSGAGESSDAHHISAPDPTGSGAYRAMKDALREASLEAGDVNYINLHGTGTEQNDLMESKAVDRLFGNKVSCGSTKPLSGHCLGASGAIEAGLCWLLLQADHNSGLPIHPWDAEVDDKIVPISLVSERSQCVEDIRCVLSNSFAFGGSNISLLMEKHFE